MIERNEEKRVFSKEGGGKWQASESDGEEEKVKFFQTEEGVSLKRPAPLDTTQTI